MKIADEKALQELALKQQEQEKAKKESTIITEEELDELYHLGTQEINNLKLVTSSFKKILKDSFYGDFMFEETLTNIFFETMDNSNTAMQLAKKTKNVQILKYNEEVNCFGILRDLKMFLEYA